MTEVDTVSGDFVGDPETSAVPINKERSSIRGFGRDEIESVNWRDTEGRG